MITTVFSCLEASSNFAVDDDLRAGVAFGFQQYRVHVSVGFDFSYLRLDHLRSAHLSTVGGDVGVAGHVLGFERGYFYSDLRKDTAEGGCDDAFAD